MNITRLVGTLAIVLLLGAVLPGVGPIQGAYASEVEVEGEEMELEGVIEDLHLAPDGTGWVVIGGRTILIDENTDLDEGLAVGADADVDFVVLPDGTLLATQIEVDAPDSVLPPPPETP